MAQSANNAALVRALGLIGQMGQDDITALAAGTQAGAPPVTSAWGRVTVAAANATVLIKGSRPITHIINDSPNTIVIYPEANSYLNGVQNGTLSLVTGKSASFISIPKDINANLGGGTETYRAGVIG